MNSENHLGEMESLFLALADKTRLRILNLMRRDEICVCYITEILGESQPKISRHLAYLRNAGIVSARREGKWMNYRIEIPSNNFAAELLDKTLVWLAAQKNMRDDYERLTRLCGAGEVSDITARSPIPETFAQTDIRKQARVELETFLL